MSKYRIVKITRLSGNIEYQVQEKMFFFFWFPMEYFDKYFNYSPLSYNTYEEALEFVNKCISNDKKREGYKIKKKEVITTI